MRIKSKIIVGIMAMSVLLMLVTTASAAVFSGLENEETIWTDTGTTTLEEPTDSIGDLFGLGIRIFLILIIAILILSTSYKKDKGIAVGYIIAESCVIISLMFLIVGIKEIDGIFIISAVVAQIIPLKLMIDDRKKTVKF